MSDDFPRTPVSAMSEEQRRELAIRRIKARYEFRIHLVVYLIVNAALVALWWATNQPTPGFFWPVIPIVAWGIGLALHAYTVYFPPTLSEDDIQRELGRLH